MPTTLSEELLENAVKLHGHLGPFLVLGLKMSLRAERILGGKPEKCVVKTINSKPFLCVLDGIKVRIGNDSVTVREGKSLSARFSKVMPKMLSLV
jgi:formylmethanofuran dehydrogenase subunit E